MKYHLMISIIIVAAIGSKADDAQTYISLCEQAKQLRTELAWQGAYAFVTNRETTPLVAPYIHSQCWVDWLPKTNVEQIAYEQEKRDFGLDFVGELEKLALLDIPLDDIDELEAHAEQMLTIAEWLKTARGYGNQILKRWSEGVALSSIGGMSVNSMCDTNRVVRLLNRIDDLRCNLVRQVDILNEESPHQYTVPKCVTIDEATFELEKQWRPHQKSSKMHFMDTSKISGQRVFEFCQAKESEPQYAFYLPDRSEIAGCSDPVKVFWCRKNHETVCIYATDRNMIDQIRHILRYRALLGDIPRPTNDELNDLNLGFLYRSRLHDQWRSITKNKEEFFLGGDAVLKVYGHNFVDWNSLSLRLQRKMQKRNNDQ